MAPPSTSNNGSIELVQALRPTDMTAELTRELIDCWIAVANAGGAVGFAFPPVDLDQVEPVAEQLIASLDPQYSRLLLATIDDKLVGWLSLSRHRDHLVRHWGTIRRVQTHPDHRGLGIGTALVNRIRQIARDEMGLEQLQLGARGGEGLEEFYSRLGWKEIGRWPDALRFEHGDRDEVLMLLKPL